MADRGDSLPHGRLRRGLPLIGLTARTVGGTTSAPDRYAELLGRSRGALMKAGQMLSFVAMGAALPDDQRAIYQAALARLQDDAPPMPPNVAVGVVETELRRPLLDAFAEFDPAPIAAASIGQVHAARLHDGRAVAVKVQYPGVDDAIRSDLRNGQLLASFLKLGRGLTSIRTDVTALAGELARLIAAELDYRAEAAHQAEFAAAYRGHRSIRIPEVVMPLCTSRVITMDLATGQRWAEALTGPSSLRDRWGQAIVRFALGSMRRLHMINADMHPGNYLFHEDGSVTFLDFGCVKRYTTAQVATLEAAAQAAVDGDASELSRVLAASGFTDNAGPPEPRLLLDWLREALTPVIAPQPFIFTPQFAAALAQTDLSRSGRHADVISKLTVPPDFLSIARVNLEVTAVLGALRAAGDWAAIRCEPLEDQ